MNQIIFRQLLNYIPQKTLRRFADKYEKNFNANHKLSVWEQFICMAFAQLTFCSGLREIESSLSAVQNKLYHLGISVQITKSTLSRTNNKRPSIIFKKLALHLAKRASNRYKDDHSIEEISSTIYLIDSTFVKLCLSLFPWGKIGSQDYAGLKIHTLLNLNGLIPTIITVSKGFAADNKFLDQIVIEAGAFYVMDKAYVDFKRLFLINLAKGFFIVRFKNNINFERVASFDFDISKGVVSDQKGVFGSKKSRKNYPDEVRKIVYFDKEKNKQIIFLTNNFAIKPETIALLYKKRWQIEIFFKWIKQNLRIKKFYGTTFNAVESQIWIAICTYLVVVILKKEMRIDTPLHQILHILSFSLFLDDQLFQLLKKPKEMFHKASNSNQLELFS